MSFSISSGQGYDLFGNAANISPPDVLPALGPFTGADDDNDFEINEDITGNGNEYLGLIEIGGVFYPVITGDDGMGGPASDFVNILVPVGEPTPTFPASFDIVADLVVTPFFYCFAEGTKIETTLGDVSIEMLTRDHKVRTKDGHFVPVRWVGKQTVSTSFGTGRRIGLVKFTPGSLGDGLPREDLIVTADHAMFLDGMLIQASALVNGTSIEMVDKQDLPSRLTVYHVETETHDVIFANGAASETFLDVGSRRHYDNYQEYLDIVGAERLIPALDVPRVTAARLLTPNLKARFGLKDSTTDLKIA